jgi:HAD superfamily hydrolase (TIGR01509 family)
MIKAVLLDYAGVIKKRGDIFSDAILEYPKEFENSRTVFEKAKENIVNEKEFTNLFSKERLDWFYKNNFLHDGMENFLKNNKFDLFIASNYVSSVLEKELDFLNIRKYFKKIFVSDKLGVTKPNKEFFEKVLKEIPYSPNEIVFVDDQKKNLKTAKELGLKTIWINNNTGFGDNDSFIADKEISNINLLNNIVSELDD